MASARLGAANFPEAGHVSTQDSVRVQVESCRHWAVANQVVHNQPNRRLALKIRPLIDRGNDSAILEIRHHFTKGIGCDEFYLPGPTGAAQDAAYWKAIDGVYRDAGETCTPTLVY
jgi:hypothetical protein